MMVMFAAAGYLALAAAVLALRGRPAYPAAKAMAGAGFCVLAAVCAWQQGGTPWPWPLPAGFALCAAGDVAMGRYNLYRRPRALLWGILLFAAGHLCFLAGLALRRRPGAVPLVFAVAAALALAAALLRGWLDMGRLAPGGVLYCFAVSLMAAQAAALAAGSPCTGTLLFAAGSVLFWASDLVLLGLYFSRRRGSRVLHIANLTSYYAGMLLMALSMAWPAGFA